MLYWISLGLAGVAFVVIVFVVLRHWKEIRLLNPQSIQEELERQKREALLLQRFERVTKDRFVPLKALFQKIVHDGKSWYHRIYLRLVRLEKFYKQAKTPFAFLGNEAKDRIRVLLDDARTLRKEGRYADAEKRYLEVLASDQRNPDAYKGLGLIYFKQKLFPQARETFEFLVKAKKADDTCFSALADIAEHDGDMERVEDMRRRAIEMRPRFAQRHAELAEFYLKQHQPAKAWPFAKQAGELEPSSSKYLELSIETAILLGDRNEARRQYDKLRLVSDDRLKFQTIKEKIDGMPT